MASHVYLIRRLPYKTLSFLKTRSPSAYGVWLNFVLGSPGSQDDVIFLLRDGCESYVQR